ncbi:MAG: glycoside hydrolase family 57 [Chromatiales bacterium]|jgi:alpha-amylase/alpha-mannosidase (GH57 family)
MTEQTIAHALGLHMHQPPGNLQLLIEDNPWEAEQIIRCYERVPRYAAKYRDVGHLHVGFSGILLEQFLDPKIVDAYRHIVDIPAMLENYREASNVELIGMGYYHPIFPLIPRNDWADQLQSGRAIMQEVFGRAPKGFWPPEMAFTMEMIPALLEAGYEYVVVDSVHVQPQDGIHDIYRPYLACHEGHCITVIPRDRAVSNAQESGLNPSWFANEIQLKVEQSPRPDAPRLVTTWSDGENGGWFRQTDEDSGFFGFYFAPYMERVRRGEFPSQTVSLSSYIKQHAPRDQAHVQTGAWNVGSTSGNDFAQWAGSESQRKAVAEVVAVSQRYHRLTGYKQTDPSIDELLQQARHTLLEGETSCYLFWGDSWIPHLYEHTREATRLLAQAEAAMAAGVAANRDIDLDRHHTRNKPK